jgi:hypothetical protein
MVPMISPFLHYDRQSQLFWTFVAYCKKTASAPRWLRGTYAEELLVFYFRRVTSRGSSARILLAIISRIFRYSEAPP